MLKLHYLFVLSFVLLFCRCEKEEEPIPANDKETGEVQTHRIAMQSDYRYQVYFSLEEGQEVGQHLNTAWDISFHHKDNHILLNPSRAMYAARTDKQTLGEVSDTSGLDFKWDDPSRQPGISAMSHWQEEAYVYVIDMGYDYENQHLGFRKLIPELHSDGSITVTHALLNGNDEQEVTIQHNGGEYSYLSFANGQVSVEPSDDWDLCFTQYVHVFEDPVMPYLVTGVLTNHHHVAVAEAPVDDVEAVEELERSTLDFGFDANTIGYDWKEYFHGNDGFVVDPERIYIIKTKNEQYYKLRFLEYYNDSGERGFPLFEYQRIEW